MKSLRLLLSALLLLPLMTKAAAPPARELLPADTLALFTIPDYDSLLEKQKISPTSRFFTDPAMRPFLDRIRDKFRESIQLPLERELGIRFSDYQDLVHGQITFAVTQNGWEGGKDRLPAALLILDSKDKSGELADALATLRNRWIEAGKAIRKEDLRGVEFSVVEISGNEAGKALHRAVPFLGEFTASENDEKLKLAFAQSGSLLLVGSDPKSFEKLLVRQAGGLVSALSETPDFRDVHQSNLRNADAYGWANARTLIDILVRSVERETADAQANPAFQMPSPSNIVRALGIDAIRSAAFSARTTPEGEAGELLLQVPAAERRGLFRMILPEARDASPPPFVPADATSFNRMRIDWQKSWGILMNLINEISPQMGGLVNMTLSIAGKDKDPNFDIKTSLIANLGDDVISFEKPPRSATLQDIVNAPAISLIGSPNPGDLARAIKTVSTLIPGGNQLREREFIGRKIYTLPIPGMPDQNGETQEQSIHFAASGSYVAVSSHAPTLEEYLRGENNSRALREMPGLYEAAQKVGGLNTGWFTYENPKETLRILFELFKQDPDAFEKVFSGNVTGMPGVNFWNAEKRKEWLDFTLLPPFNQVEKYFGYTVYASTVDSRGIAIRTFTPTPPELR